MGTARSQESHTPEQGSPGRGSPASFPFFCHLRTLPSQPGFVPWAPTTSGDTPRACFEGRGGEHYPAQRFMVRNGPVVLKKAGMRLEAELASCPPLQLAVAVWLPATGAPGSAHTCRSQAHAPAPLPSLRPPRGLQNQARSLCVTFSHQHGVPPAMAEELVPKPPRQAGDRAGAAAMAFPLQEPAKIGMPPPATPRS